MKENYKVYKDPRESRPTCEQCRKPMSPSGGFTDGSMVFWTCWNCGIETWTTSVIEILPPNELPPSRP